MRILHVCSGGLDSAVLLAQMLHDGHEVRSVNFYYGSKHNRRERVAMHTINRFYDLPEPLCIDLPFVPEFFDSALLDPHEPVPEGHYKEEGMRRTVVPFRNGIMLSIAAGICDSLHGDAVSIAAHAGDHYIYPDCRPAFLQFMSSAIRTGTERGIGIVAPFSTLTKTAIVKLGFELGVPLAETYSCYNGRQKHCGACGACNERRAAFQESGVKDETEYEV